MPSSWILSLVLAALLLLNGCGNNPWNNPHASYEHTANIYYSSFSERPKTLDPARSYNVNEAAFIGQIYESPLQYHYLKRPYTLIPLTATKVPEAVYLDKNGHVLAANADEKLIAYSVYDIHIKPGIYYQPHPAFAKNHNGQYYYHHLQASDVDGANNLNYFVHTGTRELTAADYIYQIKRLAHPALQSPIFGFMSRYIFGLSEYADQLEKIYNKHLQQHPDDTFYLNLNDYDLAGVKLLDKYSYRIIIKGKYPQFIYWLAMPFFAPIPWEADYFYSQPGMSDEDIDFDWFPVGTGPYMLIENNPNRRMVLKRNPNFHDERYPSEGEPKDQAAGLLRDAGRPLPFIDMAIFDLEKESLPRWSKFIQGYYDQSGISADNFDQAINVAADGTPFLTDEMLKRSIRLITSVSPSIFYMGFNMLDDSVGGYNERARKLRLEISMAINYQEFISIFLNGRGVVAQGPIAPGIFGYRSGPAGVDPYVYTWSDDQVKNLPITAAKKLLAEAGYADGIDAKTGKPLILNLDVTTSGGPDDYARFAWMRKEFSKLGIQLQIRDTLYNRFQEKMRVGNAQMFFWGWQADYPDPENFLFLLYGPNSKVKNSGENAANYENNAFDNLFEQMKGMPNGPERQQLIDKMLAMVRYDAPWVWGYYPKDFQLVHNWVFNVKPNELANNTLKYLRIDPDLRADTRALWNQPRIWPLILLICILSIFLIPVFVSYWRKEHIAPFPNRQKNHAKFIEKEK